MKIHNPNKLPLIDYRSIKPLQGNLKDLSQKNYDKLKRVLEKRGFTAPLFLWLSPDNNYYLLDGHQRQRVMVAEDMQSYDVPYILIDAKDEQDAKAQLLEITSQYGTITQEGFDEFVIDLPEAEIVEAVNFDALIFGAAAHRGTSDDIPTDDDWAAAFEQDSLPKNLAGLRQITFVLHKDDIELIIAKLRALDSDKNVALLKALGL